MTDDGWRMTEEHHRSECPDDRALAHHIRNHQLITDHHQFSMNFPCRDLLCTCGPLSICREKAFRRPQLTILSAPFISGSSQVARSINLSSETQLAHCNRSGGKDFRQHGKGS